MTLVYGLHDLESIKEQRLEQVGTVELNDRIMESTVEHNRIYDAIFSAFTQRNERWNTTPITKYNIPSARMAKFVTEHGVAPPMIDKGSYQVGLPLMRYEDALGLTFESRRRITIEEFSRQLDSIQRGDIATSIHLFLFAVFYDTNWTFVSTEENVPDIPVKAGANGDDVVYMSRGLMTAQTADHYTAQAAAISNSADPFPAIQELLTGYVGTSANDRVVSFVGDATNVANIQALDAFHPVSRSKDIVFGDQVSLTDMSADAFVGMGDRVLGEHDAGVTVVRWKALPANYIVSFNLDADPAIGIREDEVQSLRGLMSIEAVENSGNTLLNRFRRKIGFAPVNRTGFAVHRIGNAEYAPPSQFSSIPG